MANYEEQEEKDRRRTRAMYLASLDEIEAVIRDWMQSHDLEDWMKVNEAAEAWLAKLPEVEDTDESPMHMAVAFAWLGLAKALAEHGVGGMEGFEKRPSE